MIPFERSFTAQPDDIETHKLLVSAYDANQDPAGALRQLLAAVSLSPRNLELFKDLAARYERLEQPEAAERAVAAWKNNANTVGLKVVNA